MSRRREVGRVGTAVSLVIAALLLMTACSAASQPLMFEGKNALCLPGNGRGSPIAFGTHIEIMSGSSITLKAVEAAGAEGLSVDSTSVVNLASDAGELMGETFPPVLGDNEASWETHRDAIEATISTDEPVQLVSEVSFEEGRGDSLEALNIRYTDAWGLEHTARTNLSLKVTSGGAC